MRTAETFVSQDGWLHLDVADGKFTSWHSWDKPEELRVLGTTLNIEVHLMVEDPLSVAESWLQSGVKRLIVPVQQVKDMNMLRALSDKYGTELMPSFDMSVPIEGAKDYAQYKYISVLAVAPGMSGQTVSEESFERIKFLRGLMPDVKIEFDGGVDLEVGKRALEAGADMLVSGHYIFEAGDPRENFKKLNNLKPDVS